MKKRVAKFIVCCVVCISLAVGFSITASADIIGGAGLLGGALGSLGVDLLAGGSATMAMLAPWLSSDFSIVGALTGVDDGYIKVGDQSVIIDGVEYESIFLDPSMAAELHTQAFDFITQKAITSNSSGILATGTGYCSGVPIYNQSGNLTSIHYAASFPNNDSSTNAYSIGDYTIELHRSRLTGNYYNFQGRSFVTTAPGYVNGGADLLSNPANTELWLTQYNNYFTWYWLSPRDGVTATRMNTEGSVYDEESFDYSYVAGLIDATPLPVDYGFQMFVPTQTLSQAGFSTGTYVIDGGIGTDEIIDLIQLLDDIYGEEAVLNPEFTDTIDPPPVPPQPIDTPLGEVPYEDFLDTFGQSVYGKLDSISDGIDTVGQVIAGQGTDIIDAVDTAGQSVVEELEVIGGAIDTAGQSVVDSVEESTGILEEAIEAVEDKVDELVDSIAEVVEEIMTHPLDLFSAWLDRLPEIPAIKDIFDGIKRHVGIWHYVVEWLSCIGTFLAFFIGLFGDVAYCMVVPIYACVAGAICLAFYKRFAR